EQSEYLSGPSSAARRIQHRKLVIRTRTRPSAKLNSAAAARTTAIILRTIPPESETSYSPTPGRSYEWLPDHPDKQTPAARLLTQQSIGRPLYATAVLRTAHSYAAQ